MRDIYIEYLVQKRRSPVRKLVKVLLVLAGILLAVAVVALLARRSLVLTGLAVLIVVSLTYYAATNLNLEYEYTVTNGEFDVDQITAKRKRRRLATMDLGQARAFGRFRIEEHRRREYRTRVIAWDSRSSPDLWYCVYPDENGLAIVVFSANDRLLDGIRPFLPPTVAAEAFAGEGRPN